MNNLEILYQKLIERLDEVENFIRLIELQKKVLGSTEISAIDNELLKMYLSYSEKITNSMVQYNAVIISLYACFENYIDRLSKNFFEQYYDIVRDYTKLPRQTIDNYYKQVGDFLINPQRYTGIDETKESLIQTIYANINNDNSKPFQLDLIANHSASLKMDKVIDLLNRMGINNSKNKICQNYLFRSYCINEREIPETEIDKYLYNSKTNIFLELDKLVDARNKVAHNWNEDERISLNLIKENTIPFIKLISQVILEVVISELYYIMNIENKLLEYGKAIAVYDKRILCLNNKSSKLKIGNYIFFLDSKKIYGVAKIQSLQIKGEDKSYIHEENIDVGIGLDRPVKTQYKFYYVDDD